MMAMENLKVISMLDVIEFTPCLLLPLFMSMTF